MMKRNLDSPMLLVTGAVIGYGLGIFASDQQRKEMTGKIKQVADRIDWDNLTQRIFGKSVDETKEQLTTLGKKVAKKINTETKNIKEATPSNPA